MYHPTGTINYCLSLEDRRQAHEWLMKSCPEWQGVPPKKQRFWQSRIKSLRKKVNVGAGVVIGKIPKLQQKKAKLKNTSHTTMQRFQSLQKWSFQEMELQDRVKCYKKNLYNVQTGHDTMGPKHALNATTILRNRQQEKQCKDHIKHARKKLALHRNMIDADSGLIMSVAFAEIKRVVLMEKIGNVSFFESNLLPTIVYGRMEEHS